MPYPKWDGKVPWAQTLCGAGELWDGTNLVSLENQAKEKETAVSERGKDDLMTKDIILSKNTQDPEC